MDTQQVFNVTQLDDVVFGNIVKRRFNEATGHWDKSQKLKTIREKNNKDYLARYVEEQLIDTRYEEVYVDNRQFVSVRTILPFLTARVTAPEVTPSAGDDIALQFADDFEQAMQKHLEDQNGRGKVRLAVQDPLRGERVGWVKWRYDASLDDVVFEHVPAGSITVGKRSKLYEEPDFIRHTQSRTVADLLVQFPNKQQKILELFGVDKGVPSQLEKEYEINEDWIFINLDGKRELIVGWSWQNFVFGKCSDPNWNDNGKNIIKQHMMPFAAVNFLNDGSGWIDQTSFMEQAKWSQSNYNKRGQVIAESAKYGGTGVPIFAKDAISQKDVAKIRFSPIQRVLLDVSDVNKAFTTWQAQSLPQYIVEDQDRLANSIDNTWAANATLRGQQSENKTATQDVLNRNQAEGRLADPIDCIDDFMSRVYLLLAQMMYVYFDDKKFYNYLGDDGKFVSLVVSQDKIAKNLGITIAVKAGTSLPIDRAQKRATVIQLLQLNRIGTLAAYKELGIFDDPEQAFKDYLLELSDPKALLGEVDKNKFDREASEDLQMVIGGKIPDERDEVTPEYLNHLNEYLLTDKFKFLKQEEQSAVSRFIDAVIAKSDRLAAKLAMQPMPGGLPPAGTQPPQDPNAPPVDPNAPQSPADVSQGAVPPAGPAPALPTPPPAGIIPQ